MGSDVSEGLGRVGTSAVDAFVAGLEEIDGVDPRVAAILQRLHAENRLSASAIVEALRAARSESGQGDDGQDQAPKG